MAEIKGILGTKLGMTQIFDDTRAIPVTVIKAGPCFVAQVKTEEKDGYSAVQLAFGATRPNELNKPEQGHFDRHGGQIGRHVVEIRTDDAGSYEPGQELRADVFEAVRADAERNLLLLLGAIPGAEGGLEMVRSAVKAPAAKGGR